MNKPIAMTRSCSTGNRSAYCVTSCSSQVGITQHADALRRSSHLQVVCISAVHAGHTVLEAPLCCAPCMLTCCA